MVNQTLITELKQNFQFILGISDILGVVLFGSHVTGEDTDRSDVDICIISKNIPDSALWEKIELGQSDPKEVYSIHFFHELPLYIQKDVFIEGEVIMSPDIPALYEFFYPYRKRWEDNRYIIEQA